MDQEPYEINGVDVGYLPPPFHAERQDATGSADLLSTSPPQRDGRRSIPRVLSVHDTRVVLKELTEPYRTMVLIAACLGLRASEITGLQWGDFNWEELTLLVRRSVVQGRVGETKTEASRFPLPIDPSLADALRAHWQRSLRREPCDWVFANCKGNHAGRRAFCDGTSSLQPCVPALARSAGTRFGIPAQACCAE